MKQRTTVLRAGRLHIVVLALLLYLIPIGCGREIATPSPTARVVESPSATSELPTETPLPATLLPTATLLSPTTSTPESGNEGLTADQLATLRSLEKVDDYPFYTMRYFGPYERERTALLEPGSSSSTLSWGCSLFAALGDSENMLYGRNFDWQYSPALLLFTDPPGSYASVTMVDIAYLGFGDESAGDLDGLPLEERKALLRAPFLPFDGMNEQGVAVGMAAVPPGEMQPDPQKETVDSLGVIRAILDQAADVDEAVAIMEGVNVDMGGGPPIHYLIADRSGRAVLVEFYQGEMVVIPNTTDWHLATNFLRSAVDGTAGGQCWRYDTLDEQMTRLGGRLTGREAMDLLSNVAQPNTQWSVVYGINSGDVTVSMGRDYESSHSFNLVPVGY